MNELILFIESAGLAWWGSLLVIAAAAIFFLILDRPAVSLSARKQREARARKVA